MRLLAGLELEPRLLGKVDLSGVVQQTLIEANAISGEWESWNNAQRVTWLRKALVNNLCDEIRKFTNQGRDVDREISLDRALEASSQRIEKWLADSQPSPSSNCRRDEDLMRLADAMEHLPEDQRRTIQLHHLRGMSLAETAAALDRTSEAVAGLLYRGLKRLRDLMA